MAIFSVETEVVVFRAIIWLSVIIVLRPCVALCGTPEENDGVEAIIERIEQRHIGEPSVYRGVYRIWSQGTVEDVRQAIAFGVDLNAWEPQRPVSEHPLHRSTMPPLMIAINANPDMEVVRILLDGGADPNLANSADVTPLHLAAAKANPELTKLLLEAGAQADAVDEGGGGAFHHLWASGSIQKPSDIEATLTLLLDVGLDPNAAMNNEATPLHVFAERGEVADAETAAGLLPVLRMFIERGANPRLRTGKGYEPIWGLSRRQIGYDRVQSARLPRHLMRLLVDSGFDINAQNDNGGTIMMYAAKFFTTSHVNKERLLEDFSILLDMGADPDIRDATGKTAFDHLHQSAKRILLESSLGKRMGSPFQGFFALCADGTLAEVEKALSEGASVNAGTPDYLNTTPLSLASFRNPDPAVAAILLEKGANPHQANRHGMTALHFAAQTHNSDVARLLLGAKADPNAVDSYGGFSPLHYVFREVTPEKMDTLPDAFSVLVQAGADPNILNSDGETPLHEFMKTLLLEDVAALRKVLPPLRDFIMTGADPDAADNSGGSPLFTAIKTFTRTFPELKVRIMAELGCDINYQDSQGRTALMLVARKYSSLTELMGCKETRSDMVHALTLLLDLGADPGLQDSSGRRAYSHFPSSRFPAIHPLRSRLDVRSSYKGKFGNFAQSTAAEVKEAIDSGFDVNGTTHRQQPYLSDTIANANMEAFHALLDAGANPNLMDTNQNTPIMVAAGRCNSEAIATLLRHGADANARNHIGMGAMHELLKNAHDINETNQFEFFACLRLLLEAGADPHSKSRSGDTPYDIFLHYLMVTEREPNVPALAAFIRLLAEMGGVDPFAKDAYGKSPPLRALLQKKTPWHVVDLYLELGWNINEITWPGETPLIYVTLQRYGRLYQEGGELPRLSREEFIANGHVDEIADFFSHMLERGADPGIASMGETAFDALSPFIQNELVKTPVGKQLRNN